MSKISPPRSNLLFNASTSEVLAFEKSLSAVTSSSLAKQHPAAPEVQDNNKYLSFKNFNAVHEKPPSIFEILNGKNSLRAGTKPDINSGPNAIF